MGDNLNNNFTPGGYDYTYPQNNVYTPTALTDGSAGLFAQINRPVPNFDNELNLIRVFNDFDRKHHGQVEAKDLKEAYAQCGVYLE